MAACLSLLLIPGPASAAGHRRGLHMAVLGCVTGDTDVAARRGCHTIPGATGGEGSQTGLTGVLALAAGAEHSSLYAVGNSDSAIVQLGLGPAPGAIAYRDCFTGNSFLDACTNLPTAHANAVNAPISTPTAAAISPDGRSLYVTSGDFHSSVVARFDRDPATGNLTYRDCLSGETAAGPPPGNSSCSLIPTAISNAYGSGLDGPSGIAIAAGGRVVYVTAALDQSVDVFDRDPSTGALGFRACISSNPKATGCTQVPGGRGVLDGAGVPLLSSDGKFLYVAAMRAGVLDTFAVDSTGAISYRGCFTGIADKHRCAHGRGSAGGTYTLQAPGGLVESRDGRFLYASSNYGSIVVLGRNKTSGKLTPVSCISGFNSDRGKCALVPLANRLANATPLYGVHTPTLSPNGKILLAAVRGEDGVTELRRDPHSGALSFLGCVTGTLRLSTAGKGVCSPLARATTDGRGSGFYKTDAIAAGPGNLLYAAAERDSTVSVLRP